MDLVAQYWIYGVGFAGQSLFGARMLVQWFRSEQEGKVVSPVLYWQLSLVASSIILIYGVLRFDGIIIIGQILSYYIYIRNLQLKNSWTTIPPGGRTALFLLPVIIIIFALMYDANRADSIIAQTDFNEPLIVIGAVGQIILNFRFIYQWYYSEKKKISILPLGFWIISLVSSTFILVYGFYKSDPVLLVSQTLGVLAYIRNILLYSKASLGHKTSTPKI